MSVTFIMPLLLIYNVPINTATKVSFLTDEQTILAQQRRVVVCVDYVYINTCSQLRFARCVGSWKNMFEANASRIYLQKISVTIFKKSIQSFWSLKLVWNTILRVNLKLWIERKWQNIPSSVRWTVTPGSRCRWNCFVSNHAIFWERVSFIWTITIVQSLSTYI